jgi:hypothetical protein
MSLNSIQFVILVLGVVLTSQDDKYGKMQLNENGLT